MLVDFKEKYTHCNSLETETASKLGYADPRSLLGVQLKRVFPTLSHADGSGLARIMW